MANPPPKLRGLYDNQDEWDLHVELDTSLWDHGTDGMLRFRSKQECSAFMLRHCRRGSNPDFPHLQHIFTMLVTKEQVKKYLVSKIHLLNQKYPPERPRAFDRQANVFLRDAETKGPGNGMEDFDSRAVLSGIQRRLDLPFHQMISPASTQNTLWYLFEHMRAGIFVMIRRNRLKMFVSFANRDYRNNWGDKLELDKHYASLEAYYDQKATKYRKENYIKDMMQWWANGNIICNEHQKPGEENSQYWGDQFSAPLRDLLEEACKTRVLPDCEFFINKRDYPHLKYNPVSLEPKEPYGFIHNKDDRDPKQDVELTRHKHGSYTPIVSFYCSDRFADLPFPTSEDWEAATGMVYPKTFMHKINKEGGVEIDDPRDLFTEENFRKFYKPWADKVDTAFFRGTATGGGVTPATNQRLKLAQLSHDWKTDARYNGSDGTAPFLDSAITGWNARDKKIASQPMTYINEALLPFKGGKQNFVPIYEQSKYKYVIYAEGHCAACRYGFLMRLGSVILKVESSCVADLMWYFPLLKPWVDHVPVAADMSDLAERIQWCREHDAECKVIAQNAQAMYDKYVGKQACLDYVQMICTEVGSRYHHPPKWCGPPQEGVDPPNISRLDKPYCFKDQWCLRCRDEIRLEEAKKKAEREQKQSKVMQVEISAKAVREAMLKRRVVRTGAAAGGAAEGPPAKRAKLPE